MNYMHIQWNISNLGTLGTEGSLVRCPDSRGCNVHKQGVWDSEICPVHGCVPVSVSRIGLLVTLLSCVVTCEVLVE